MAGWKRAGLSRESPLTRHPQTGERGYRAGLKVAQQIVRSSHLNAMARAGRAADLADAAYEGWTPAEVSFERG